MQIQTNLGSLFSQRVLTQTTNGTGTVLQRLSSGLRINTAKDDAAGLQISERMTAQVRGNVQAIRNVNDGVGILQVAEGAMTSTIDMLQRIRELAVEANNASLSTSDRYALQQESIQLLNGITKIGVQTEFNGDQVFSQSTDSIGGNATRRAVSDGLKLGWIEESEALIKKYFGIVADGATLTINFDTSDGAGNTLASVSGSVGAGGKVFNQSLNVDMADFVPPNLPDGGTAPFYNDRVIAHEMVHAVMGRAVNMAAMPTWFLEGAAELIHGADERLAGDIQAAGGSVSTIVTNISNAWTGTSRDYSSAYAATRYLHDKLKGLGVEGGIKGLMQKLASTGSNLDTALNAVTGGTYASTAAFLTDFGANGVNYINTRMNLTNTDTGGIGGFDADSGAVRSAKDVLSDQGSTYADKMTDGFRLVYPTVAGGTGAKYYQLQLGSNPQQTLTASFTAVNAQALGVDDIDLVKLPTHALAHIDEALDYLNKQRAQIGAQLSRLAFSSQNLSFNVENTSSSRSRIRDADYASETAALARQQILQQSGTAMVTQANQLPKLALQLLR
ncbi:flagellin [Chitinivorax tropicus]|uniref:Flagellin n=1 Tax=Chitinivorax tropicus TaxID=714531 RepID=A0A840MSD9_9PROT|nr:flagellinolysin [Chitinivorax tropicus]MBB5019326.1 flagellin [Chitinivorax tropicus]